MRALESETARRMEEREEREREREARDISREMDREKRQIDRERARDDKDKERESRLFQKLHVLEDKLSFVLKHTHTHVGPLTPAAQPCAMPSDESVCQVVPPRTELRRWCLISDCWSSSRVFPTPIVYVCAQTRTYVPVRAHTRVSARARVVCIMYDIYGERSGWR